MFTAGNINRSSAWVSVLLALSLLLTACSSGRKSTVSSRFVIDQSLLMIAGSRADSYYMTDGAFKAATGTQQKELLKIEGATHIETYWVQKYVDQAVNKLSFFFGKNL